MEQEFFMFLLHFTLSKGLLRLLSWLLLFNLAKVQETNMEFDAPCFKILASNDTSGAPGHQGGIVIPKDIAPYFPELPNVATSTKPTVDVELKAELLLDGTPVGEVNTRYQHQTWGGKRSPERRLTSNLGILRDAASAGDIILFQRSLSEPFRIRINLVRRKSSLFPKFSELIGAKKWGTLIETPSSISDAAVAETELQERIRKPFELFADVVDKVQTSALRIARSRIFQKTVLKNFDYSCAVSRRKLEAPSGAHGIDAAHIVPLSRRGTNDLRNGIALSKELHWAFDAGIICFVAGKVLVSDFVRTNAKSEYLLGFNGVPILETSSRQTQPDNSAFIWHRENIFVN